ncbi:MAG: MarR family transcriptional regulator [Sphingobacteriaceae bacterium]|nr:MarR family transcriptional regulator [Sphingobacteriaceae bacterium]
MKLEDEIKQSKFESSYQKAIINIIYTSNWLRDQQMDVFRAFDVLPQHYNVLRIIKGKHPKPCSPGEIKEVMLDKGNDVTRLVDKLVKKGLVKRNLCESNRRKIDITITEKGVTFIKEISDPMKKQLSVIKKLVSEKEAEQLSDILDKIRG